MTIPDTTRATDDFEAFINLPENNDKVYERIGGEIIEKMPSNPFVSMIAARILGFLFIYLQKNDLGYVTGEKGSYRVMGERYAPDVSYISYVKQAELAKQGYTPNPPDLAVEVVSADTYAENAKLTVKLGNYLAADVVLWIVRPEDQTIEVYEPSQAVKVYREGDIITVGEMLPDFSVAVDDIFKTKATDENENTS